MGRYIDKTALVAEIERRIMDAPINYIEHQRVWAYNDVKDVIDTLEVIDPYEQVVQYPSIRRGIEAHAETYSFNIESELFNQLTPEQQKLWRKEIEQAVISGGEVGVELARDARYKENLEVKEVYLEKEIAEVKHNYKVDDNKHTSICSADIEWLAKHFFELGLQVNNPITAADRCIAEEIIVNLKRLEKDYRIDLTKEIEWLRNKVKKGE